MFKSNSPIRVGLIGYGLAGAFIHAPLIEAAGGYRIAVISTSRADAVAARRDAPRAVQDPFEVCRSQDVDLVVVASPNDTHYPLGMAALEAGKAVVIDKPLAPSSNEVNGLIAAAERANLILTAFHNRRGDGSYLAVRQVLSEGCVGEPLLFESRWDRFQPDARSAWRNSAQSGAGLLWDLGPHLLDQALQIFGTPDSVAADIVAQRDGAVCDDYFELTLKYGRMRCVLSASTVVAAPRPRFSVHGSKGSLTVPAYNPIEAALRAGRHPGAATFFKDVAPISADLWNVDGHRRRDFAHGDWIGFYTDLRATLTEGRALVVSPQEILQGVQIIEAAHREAAARRPNA